jgi:diacylglycerol O-acyltransferase
MSAAARKTAAPRKTDSERMSRVDTAWLRMDSDANLMMIVGVWLLRPRVRLADVQRRVGEALLKYPRFVQCVHEDVVTGASWVDDDGFDIAHHVVPETLAPRRRGRARNAGPEASPDPLQALKTRVAELAARPLDHTRPLWQFHVVEDLDGERSALVARVHHCIGDGIALISVMLSIADGGAPPPERKRRVRASGADNDDDDGGDWLADAILRPVTDLTAKAIGMTGSGMARGLELLSRPRGEGRAPGRSDGGPAPAGGSERSERAGQRFGALDIARIGGQVLSDLAAFALMSDDSTTRLKGKAQPGKRVAWGEPLPLDAVKLAGKVMGVSINDVLLSCVAGAIGAYLRDKGDDPTGQEIRAMVPVNLRPLEKAWQLGNRFGLVPLVLPIGIAHPLERLYAVHARMGELKGSYQPLLAFGVLAVAGLTIKPVQDAILGLFAKKSTAVMTNVPGPKDPIRFCGSTVEQVMFWVPQSGDIGMGVSILSYGGGVQFGLITDARMCPDPEAIIERFAPEFDKLLLLALMAPWES